MIKQFISNNSRDARVVTFSTNKAIERQYHTYFDWKQTTNINQFLGLFGSDFRETVSSEIKNNGELAGQVEAFLIIGAERNKMVHGNFLEYVLEKSFDDLVSLHEKALRFIEYLTGKFIPR